MRILFIMTGCHGRESGASWQDRKLGVEHYADIERVAMVGKKRWQHGMTTICKPFTQLTVRFFDNTGTAQARDWLGEV